MSPKATAGMAVVWLCVALLAFSGCKKDGNLQFMHDYYAAEGLAVAGYTNADIRVAEQSLKTFIGFLEQRRPKHRLECGYAIALADERMARLCEMTGRRDESLVWRHKRADLATELCTLVSTNVLSRIPADVAEMDRRLNPGWLTNLSSGVLSGAPANAVLPCHTNAPRVKR